jgi:hypothetical protein
MGRFLSWARKKFATCINKRMGDGGYCLCLNALGGIYDEEDSTGRSVGRTEWRVTRRQQGWQQLRCESQRAYPSS